MITDVAREACGAFEGLLVVWFAGSEQSIGVIGFSSVWIPALDVSIFDMADTSSGCIDVNSRWLEPLASDLIGPRLDSTLEQRSSLVIAGREGRPEVLLPRKGGQGEDLMFGDEDASSEGRSSASGVDEDIGRCIG